MMMNQDDDEDQQLLNQLSKLKEELPDLVEDVPTIAEPSVDKPFSLPPRQRMDPMDLVRDQIQCAKMALKERRAAKRAGGGGKIAMKKTVKQIGDKFFSYTANEQEIYVLNNASPLRCSVTTYNDLAIFNLTEEDRETINKSVKEMALNSGMKGEVQQIDEKKETLFVKMDSNTQLFDAEKKPLTSLPKKSLNLKVCIRFVGVIKYDNVIRPMLRVYQAKVEPMKSLTKLSCMFD